MAERIDAECQRDRSAAWSSSGCSPAARRPSNDKARPGEQPIASSILDFVLEDARDLQRRLGAKDRRKMDEYLTLGPRDRSPHRARPNSAARKPLPDYAKPTGIPKDYAEHIRLMADLMVLAFQGDLTRVATFVFANEGSNRSYPFIDVPEGHHDLSHHGGNAEKQAQDSRDQPLPRHAVRLSARKLRAVREGERSLLDNSMIVYGSGISDGNRHNHDDLPILLAGRGGGTINTGRHVRYDKRRPINNLYLAMLDRIDAPADSLGDSSGKRRTELKFPSGPPIATMRPRIFLPASPRGLPWETPDCLRQPDTAWPLTFSPTGGLACIAGPRFVPIGTDGLAADKPTIVAIGPPCQSLRILIARPLIRIYCS